MKKNLITLGMALTAVLTLTSCVDELPAAPDRGGLPYAIMADAVESKTVNDGMKTKWAEGDDLNVFHAAAGTTEYGLNTEFTVEDVAAGKFTTPALNGTLAETNDWYVLYPYSEHTKTPTKSGYMPVGAGTNFMQVQKGNNSTAHIAGANYPMWGVAKGVSSETLPGVGMTHVSSLVAVEVFNKTDEPLTVTSVAFEAPEDINGTYYINFTGDTPVLTGSGTSYVSKTANLKVENGEAVAAGASAKFYLAIKPFTALKDQTLKMSVNGVGKTVTLSADLAFNPGKIRTLKYNYEAVAEEMPAVIADGDYVVAYKDGEKFYAMTTDEGGYTDRRGAVEIDYAGSGSFAAADANMTWTISKASAYNKFTIKNGDSYVGYDKNKAPLVAAAYECTFEAAANEPEYVITSANGYRLTLNTALNSGKIGGFGFYSGKSNTIFVIPLGEDTRTQLATPRNLMADAGIAVPNSVEVVWDAVENATGYTVTCGTETKAVTDEYCVFENLEYSKSYTVTVVANGDPASYKASAAASTTVTTGENPNPDTTEPSAGAYTLVTSATGLAVGDKVVIVASEYDYALSTTQNTNNRAQAAVTKTGSQVSFESAVQVLTLEEGTKSGTWSFNTGAGYLYAASSSKNYLKTEQTKSDNSSWVITVESGVATIKAQGTYTHNWVRYNSTNNPPIFSCYSSGQADVSIYKLSDGEDGEDGEGGGSTEPEPTPAVPASCGWLEMPSEGNVATATEYKFEVDGERNYTAYYDSDTYAALWVAYPLAKGHMGSLKRPDDWSYAPEVPQEDQVDLTKHSYSSYNNGNGHAKGHQIANADRNGNEQMQLQTFYVINSTPQYHNGLNQDVWADLEGAVRGAVPSGDSLYVVTGPVFQTVGGSETIDYTTAADEPETDIPVPNYYFKAVLKVRRSGNTVTAASTVGFWFENRSYASSDYTLNTMSVDEIERKTGLDLFVNLPDAIEEAAEKNTSWGTFTGF